jgi:hypothetical protein
MNLPLAQQLAPQQSLRFGSCGVGRSFFYLRDMAAFSSRGLLRNTSAARTSQPSSQDG